MKVGYYVFFGNGDYHPNSTMTKRWISTWDISEWKSFINELLDLEITTLLIYLNGHKLPYKSSMFPELVDKQHLNTQNEFLEQLLVYAKSKGLEIIAVLTTTGHAGLFSELNEDTKIIISKPDASVEDTLISFPETIRKGKLSKQEGSAQVGYGVLCHNKPTSQKYAENIITEIISMYGKYIDGITLHPPESAYPCACDRCNSIFFSEYGKSIEEADTETARQFFIKTYLEFQCNSLFPLIKKMLPDCSKMMFTVPWLFESSLLSISPFISKELTIIEWDYNLDPKHNKTS